MSIYSMLYNGLSGINSMSGSMGVASDNVANVNTPSYKSSRMNFADLISLSQAEIGQVGTGSQTGDITKDYKPGQMERTDRSTDLAITGNGFFMLRDEGLTDTFYTRDGQFRAAEITGDANAPHKLVNNEGYFVQGINTGSMENPTGTIEDIVVLNKSLPKATESTMAAFNLENDPLLTEAVESSLFANWDGTNLVNGVPAPINPDDYSYSNIMKIYDDTPEKSEYEMTIYFDQTTQDNEQEFLVTCEPDLDRRLIGNTGLRYNDGGTTTNKGAGALLYGKLSFNPQGELDNISCWNVPPDGNLNPTPANQIDLARGEGFYSFDFNMSGVGENLISTLNFGTEPSPQTLSSPGAAIVDYGADTQDILLYENTDWSRVYDADGNKAQNGDIINFTGNTGEGTAVSFNYTVDFNNTMADLLTSLSSEFNCKA
ncbi:MAG: flagellar hook-basal body complex protein, partial [Desulfobulbaceae bacterium]|nr:flagellar hook-basal body complex protein [Desulfobulbaceae bacterium]